MISYSEVLEKIILEEIESQQIEDFSIYPLNDHTLHFRLFRYIMRFSVKNNVLYDYIESVVNLNDPLSIEHIRTYINEVVVPSSKSFDASWIDLCKNWKEKYGIQD